MHTRGTYVLLEIEGKGVHIDGHASSCGVILDHYQYGRGYFVG